MHAVAENVLKHRQYITGALTRVFFGRHDFQNVGIETKRTLSNMVVNCSPIGIQNA